MHALSQHQITQQLRFQNGLSKLLIPFNNADSKLAPIAIISPVAIIFVPKALASKATGYPIAKLAAKIALGYGLDEIKNAVTQKTYACFEPTLDYVVVKIPKWPFDKFFTADRALGTKMMATGEIMAIGANLESALLKGIRSLEIGKYSIISSYHFCKSK